MCCCQILKLMQLRYHFFLFFSPSPFGKSLSKRSVGMIKRRRFSEKKSQRKVTTPMAFISPIIDDCGDSRGRRTRKLKLRLRLVPLPWKTHTAPSIRLDAGKKHKYEGEPSQRVRETERLTGIEVSQRSLNKEKRKRVWRTRAKNGAN